jgi:hypothetical protein
MMTLSSYCKAAVAVLSLSGVSGLSTSAHKKNHSHLATTATHVVTHQKIPASQSRPEIMEHKVPASLMANKHQKEKVAHEKAHYSVTLID